MDTQEALRVVESALNERKALARMAEVLGNVMGAEILEAELHQKIVVLSMEIDNIGAARDKADEDLEDARAEGARVIEEMADNYQKKLREGENQVQAVAGEHILLLKKMEESEVQHSERQMELQAVIEGMRKAADAEEARLAKAKKSLDAIKKLF